MDISLHVLNAQISNNKIAIDNLKIDNKNIKETLNLLLIENKNLKFRIIELEKIINSINNNSINNN